jgi:2-polyprenyl-6-methoxyphenol hydroxylase-like FAD-dependent oxidoreductase
VSVLRWHALSGYSLELTQFTGGRVTIEGDTRALLDAIAAGAPVERRLEATVTAVTQRGDRVDVTTREGAEFAARGSTATAHSS